MSDFMQRQITAGNTSWLKVETNQGTYFVRLRDTELAIPLDAGNADDEPERAECIQQYVGGSPESWETITGYGARLSAPGYLDCTEWTVFDSEDEARAYLDEYYPEDEEDSGEES